VHHERRQRSLGNFNVRIWTFEYHLCVLGELLTANLGNYGAYLNR
jgi:hypothetical protein